MYPRHKFNAKPTEVDGFKFPSKREAAYYADCKLRQRSGELVFFLRQVPIHLPGGVKYVVDFQEFRADGSVHFVDPKGMMTQAFIDKKKMVESLYPIEIEIVK